MYCYARGVITVSLVYKLTNPTGLLIFIPFAVLELMYVYMSSSPAKLLCLS